MTNPDLVELVRTNQLSTLEDAWAEALVEPGEVGAYCQTIEALCKADMAVKALSLASVMVEALAEKERVEDARNFASVVVSLGIHNDKFARKLFELIELQDGGESWHALVKEFAAISSDNFTVQSLANYEKLRRYTKGHVLYHRAGWGEGLVEEFNPDSRELTIRFVSGRVQEMSISGAIDSMVPLDEDDLRAMRILAKDELERLAKEDPSILIRKAAKVFRGKINSTKVKEALCPSVVPTKKWNSFWKRAKAAAAHDPWLQVEGSATRPVFVLRKKPLSLADEARREVRYADDIAHVVRICGECLKRCHDDAARNTILDIVQDRVEAALQTSEGGEDGEDGKEANLVHLLEAILLLVQHGRKTSVSAAEKLRDLVCPDDEFKPEALGSLATEDSQEHAISVLPESLGENWAEICVNGLTRFPVNTVEPVVEAVVEAGQGHLLLKLWGEVAPYPRRHPMLTYLMGRLYADGVFDGQEGCPDRISAGRVLLHLTRILSSERRSSTIRSRILSRLVSLLTGRRNFLKTILEEVNRDSAVSYLGISERGGPDFPHEVANLILRTVARRFPDVTAKQERPFWELDYIYVTREGLARHRESYRVLVEEKIPANSKAIGVAASHGDISENSEWEAAMEEQRNLTGRANYMDEELRRARLIEEQHIPIGVVAPGTRVRFTDLADNSVHVVRLLGPWDADGDDTLNYQAPMGQALLGMRPGASVRAEIGGHLRELHVNDIEVIL